MLFILTFALRREGVELATRRALGQLVLERDLVTLVFTEGRPFFGANQHAIQVEGIPVGSDAETHHSSMSTSRRVACPSRASALSRRDLTDKYCKRLVAAVDRIPDDFLVPAS